MAIHIQDQKTKMSEAVSKLQNH